MRYFNIVYKFDIEDFDINEVQELFIAIPEFVLPEEFEELLLYISTAGYMYGEVKYSLGVGYKFDEVYHNHQPTMGYNFFYYMILDVQDSFDSDMLKLFNENIFNYVKMAHNNFVNFTGPKDYPECNILNSKNYEDFKNNLMIRDIIE